MRPNPPAGTNRRPKTIHWIQTSIRDAVMGEAVRRPDRTVVLATAWSRAAESAIQTLRGGMEFLPRVKDQLAGKICLLIDADAVFHPVWPPPASGAVHARPLQPPCKGIYILDCTNV